MGKLPDGFAETIKLVSERLTGHQYAIRGTASLVLQGIDMNVDDIDVIGDQKMAEACNGIFKEFMVNPVTYSESPKFKSYFGTFSINGVQVEIMGEWQIKNVKGLWTLPYSASQDQIKLVDGCCVTRVETELAMFAAMGRWTAFNKIKKNL